MVAKPASPFRSANAGEFSPDVKGRIDIKQYYSAGLANKNVEPVPQSGFRQMGGTRRIGKWRRPLDIRAVTDPGTAGGPHTGTQVIWAGTVAGTVAAMLVAGLAVDAGAATFEMQALFSGVWTRIGGPFVVFTGIPATRFAALPPGQQQVATGVRIVATFSTSASVTIAGVNVYFETGTAIKPRHCALTLDNGTAISAFITAAVVDFWTAGGHIGAAWAPAITADMLPDLDFYAEASTIGVFHGGLQTQRLLLTDPARPADWRVDLWPYDPVPKADLGGAYVEHPDVWTFFVRWSGGGDALTMNFTVDGETTPSVSLGTTTGAASSGDWLAFCAAIKTELEALSGLGPTITVASAGAGNARQIGVTFGGDLLGQEYDFAARVVNTAEISALVYHEAIGKTELEDLFSVSRGWPGTVGLVQDRLAYGRIPAVTGALATSRVAEYFDLDAAASTDQAARLDRIRSQTSEIILHIKDARYLLVFTDRGAYFATNRTIERNTPLNFVLASETGAQPNAAPFDLEGEIYYVAIPPEGFHSRAGGGKRLLRIVYDDVSTTYNADPVSLLASHLVDHVVRTARQRPDSDQDASKGWLLRSDGRLIATQIIKNQEISGFCEWIAAASGAVGEIGIDGKNRLWLAVDRGGDAKTVEIYDNDIFLQDALAASTDLAGAVSVAGRYGNGETLWAVADGYVLGPFTVSAGAINLEDPYDSVLVGRWQPPRFESMPQVYVTPGEDVVLRPGRIHTAHVNVIDTTSIAIGANGEAPATVPLARAGDPVDQPTPARTEMVTATGMTGWMTGTTLVITQTRPGKLRVRDYALGSKL